MPKLSGNCKILESGGNMGPRPFGPPGKASNLLTD